MKNTYIKLADFAKAIGKNTEEARLILIQPALSQYYLEDKGLVSTAVYKAMEDKPAEAEKPASKEQKPATSRSDNPPPAERISQEGEEIERLKKENAELRASLEKKNEQLADFALRFAELAQQAQTIAGQAQFLQLNANPPKEIEARTEEAEAPEPQKKGFFKRLFGR